MKDPLQEGIYFGRKYLIFYLISWVSTSNARDRLRREIRALQGPPGPAVSGSPNFRLYWGKTGPPAQNSPATNWTKTKKF